MARTKRMRLLGANLPMWVGRTLSALGLSTIIYGLIRYTFIGEFFERLYRDTIGHSPIDDFVDSFDPREDVRQINRDVDMLKDAF